MLISSTISNLVNGVSQQPDALRLSSQAEEQDNFLSSVVEGLKRRPSSRHIARLTSDDWSTAFLHTINRDRTERYSVAVTNGDLKVFDLEDGTEETISFPDGKAYLAGGRDDFRAITVADYTFLLNRSIETAMGNARSAARNPIALFHVAGGNYSKTFRIEVNGNTAATFTTPDGSLTGHVAQISTDTIANQLFNGLTSSLTDPQWSITRVNNVIMLENLNGTEFDVTTTDGFNDAYLKLTKDVVQSFSDLPPHAPAGFKCKVAGDQGSEFDDYYVEWVADVGSETAGVWEETLKWDTPTDIDPATMPHTLVRESDGTFTFSQADWGQREAGDEDSSPEPSFIGRTVNDIFFYRNRLGVTAGENVIMSRSGEYFSFWPKTSITLLDSDPIDVGVTHVKVSEIEHAVPFNQTLLLFSAQTQFVLDGGDILSPRTVSVSTTTEFEGSLAVRPVGAGPNVYFPVPRGSFTGVREYYVEPDSLTNNAADVTSHCPKYVPGDLFHLAASSNEDMLVALSGLDPSRIYVYKYFFGQEGKLQSSWSRWSFIDDTVLHASFIENSLYILFQRTDGVYLEEIDIETGATDEDSDFLYRVDRKVYESDLAAPVFDGTYTTWTLPYDETADLWVFIRAGDSVLPEGYVLTHDRPAPNQVRVTGDHTSSKVCLGRKYESTYEFSDFLIKEAVPGGGQASIGEGRLQILHLALDYDRTGYFSVDVTPTGRDTFIYKFTGRILGALKNVLGDWQLESGRFKFPVLARNRQVKITIRSDHFLPCSFMSAEWEARFTTRTRRL